MFDRLNKKYPTHPIRFEEDYIYSLRKFKKQFPDKSEYDFLMSGLDDYSRLKTTIAGITNKDLEDFITAYPEKDYPPEIRGKDYNDLESFFSAYDERSRLILKMQTSPVDFATSRHRDIWLCLGGGNLSFTKEGVESSVRKLRNRLLVQTEYLNWVIDEFQIKLERLPKPEIIADVLDLSDTDGKEKVIYLHELGILQFLKDQEPFVSSTYSLAQALSAVTGIPANTLVSYINPIFSKTTAQGNNPLNNTKKVERVKLALAKIGFKTE